MQREGFELDCNLTTNINYLMDHCLGEQRIPIKSIIRYTMTTFTNTRYRWIFIAKMTKVLCSTCINLKLYLFYAVLKKIFLIDSNTMRFDKVFTLINLMKLLNTDSQT